MYWVIVICRQSRWYNASLNQPHTLHKHVKWRSCPGIMLLKILRWATTSLLLHRFNFQAGFRNVFTDCHRRLSHDSLWCCLYNTETWTWITHWKHNWNLLASPHSVENIFNSFLNPLALCGSYNLESSSWAVVAGGSGPLHRYGHSLALHQVTGMGTLLPHRKHVECCRNQFIGEVARRYSQSIIFLLRKVL